MGFEQLLFNSSSIQIYEIEYDLERSTEVVGSNPTRSIFINLVKYGIELSSILSSRSTKPAALTAQFS